MSDVSGDFVLAKFGNRFLRLASESDAPKGAQVMTRTSVLELTKDKIGELYGHVAGVQPKNFKDKTIAVDSLAYQVAKMPMFDPNGAASTKSNEVTSPASTKQVKQPKKPETIELLSPPNLNQVLRELAPQSRELMLIMAELAREQGSTSFGSEDLSNRLKTPEVIERLRTRQDPLRILLYYKSRLIGSGLIRTS